MHFFKLGFGLLFASTTQAIWPLPKTIQTGTSFLRLSESFDIDLQIADAPQDLLDAISRTKDRLKNDKLARVVVGRGANSAPILPGAAELGSLTVSLTEGNEETILPLSQESVKPIGTRSEGYTLDLPEDGSSASITANSTLGILRGLTTFEQLWYDLDGVTYAYEAPVSIEDEPAYPWRGLMLDTSRNFYPVEDIKRTLDAASLVKMSTFHWHITDSQSWPLEVPEYPELSQKGAYSSGQVYSTSDVQEIVTYAAARGIDVVMEIDTPGHTAIIVEAYPDHIACPHASPWASYANEPPSGQLRLASSETANFTASLISAIVSRLPSSLFSTGGDELNTRCYDEDEETQKDLQESGRTLEQALDVFTQATHGALAEKGKTAVVWEEMLLEHDVTLANDTVVMVWISSANAAKVTAAGHRLVHAPSDYFYLDCGAGEWIGAAVGSNSWCDPFKSWQKAYTFDPLASIPESQHSLVLGGQQLLWAEQSGPENLDSIVWPRAAASAEVFWTGAGRPDGREALQRLHDLRFRLVQRGVKAIPLQPLYCALRPNVCDIDA